MTGTKSQDGWMKTALRLPRDVHAQIHAVAKEQDRTFNGQLVAMLRDGLQRHAAQAQEAAK